MGHGGGMLPPHLCIALLSLALAGCSPSSSGPSESDMVRVGENAVRQVLRDGDNADFRGSKIGAVNGAKVVCGEVNSANGFGGKSGYQRFISNGGSVTVLEEQMEAGEFAQAWAATGC